MGDLEFEQQAFVELLSEDGLIILARGLGLDRLFLKFLKLYSDPHNLVLVLNCPASLEKYFIESLDVDEVERLPRIVTNEYSIKDREQLYLEGGVLFVTSRILVTDFLRKHCPLDKVSGLLVFNGHRISDSSCEAFILTLYRESNKGLSHQKQCHCCTQDYIKAISEGCDGCVWQKLLLTLNGFIKAFSDAPEPFLSGFARLERVLRSLFLRNTYLWPRFHATVSSSLSRHKPDVVELRQQMSPSMTAIQMSVLDIMKACVAELKRYNPCLDTDEVTVENCMGKSFDQVIKLQLDPIWNQLGSKSKQLIFDLRMLRTLLYFLTQYDCVTFYSYLEAVRCGEDKRSSLSNSMWTLMDSSNMLFAKARERVYGPLNRKTKKRDGASSSTATASNSDDLLLEESPKWHLLSMVLDEIRKESKSNSEITDAGKILVIANDERTCYQLREYLCVGGHKLLQRQFHRLVTAKQSTKKQEASSVKKRGGGNQKEVRPTKKRKVDQVASEDKTESNTGAEDHQMEEVEQQILQELEEVEMMVFQEQVGDSDAPGPVMRPVPKKDNLGVLSEPVVILHSLSSSDNPYHFTKLLYEINPRYIVMYDIQVQYVRQIEVFKGSRPGVPLRVYFLLYDSSVEEQKYLTSLRKEKEAFHQLIKERAHMVVPVDQEGKVGDCAMLQRGPGTSVSAESVSTRKAGGRRTDDRDKTQIVLVDMREFRSTLPFMLHKTGIELQPLTLEVGDYILTPDICVERKSVSDLIGSLNSGRLYNQATAMTRHYKKPVLLIEFDENKPFALQNGSIQSEISSQSISSKLTLLTLHFPNLRILWCSSPYATTEVFSELKQDQLQPDAEVASVIGQDTLDSIQNSKYSATAQDFLLKLPGINSKNYRRVMEKVKDLQELVTLSEKSLEVILGSDANAGLLWSFLHTELRSANGGKASSKLRTKTKK